MDRTKTFVFNCTYTIIIYYAFDFFSKKNNIILTIFKLQVSKGFFEEMAFSTPPKEALKNTSRLNFDEVSPKHSIIMVVLILLLGSDIHKVHLS